MTNKPENPPAFPRPYSKDDFGDFVQDCPPQSGMTLRDWFAGQALNGMMVGEVGHDTDRYNIIARRANAIADAMLTERERR